MQKTFYLAVSFLIIYFLTPAVTWAQTSNTSSSEYQTVTTDGSKEWYSELQVFEVCAQVTAGVKK
jgi:hypothetical protein